MKIVTLTLNPALDKSTSVERMTPEQKLRCEPMQIDAGGGGINVSKGIHRLGGESTAVFPVSGVNGMTLRGLLQQENIATECFDLPGETRENFSVLDASTQLQYRLTFPGMAITEAQADQCIEIIRKLQPEILVASGSLPPGLDEHYYGKIATMARDLNCRFVLDTSGAALQAAANVGVYLLKPNLGELSALVGVKELQINQVDDAALEIIQKGMCEVAVISLGAQGALLVTKDGFEHVPAPTVRKKSTVGAGDSMVSGMVWALHGGKSLLEMVQTGVACGSAATMNAGTQLFKQEDAMKLLHWIQTCGKRDRLTDF